jgi:hypothetical protein
VKKILLLTLLSTHLYGQSLLDDLKLGLYQSSPDWIIVHQLVSDTIRTYKLHESRSHFDKVVLALFDSIPKGDLPGAYRRRKREIGVTDILLINDRHTSIIYDRDSVFGILNFIKSEFGYEFYTSKHKVKRDSLTNSILRDTTDYFKFSAFTLDDIKRLRTLKDFKTISKTEFDNLLTVLISLKQRHARQISNSETKSMYGTVESNEILVKILLQLKYNPLILPGDFDKVYEKYRER